MFRLIAVLAALLLPVAGGAQDLPALYRVTGVVAGDVLNIRAAPRADAPILGGLAPGQGGVEVTGLSPSGRWGRVNTGETAAWVSMRFLARESGTSWHDGEIALTCFGTEPFWRMPIFLPTHRAEFHDIDSGGFELVTDAGALPATRFPMTLAVPFSGSREGMAVIRAATCSDGMSDRLYGLEAQVYWRGDRAGLTGCCRIGD